MANFSCKRHKLGEYSIYTMIYTIISFRRTSDFDTHLNALCLFKFWWGERTNERNMRCTVLYVHLSWISVSIAFFEGKRLKIPQIFFSFSHLVSYHIFLWFSFSSNHLKSPIEKKILSQISTCWNTWYYVPAEKHTHEKWM